MCEVYRRLAELEKDPVRRQTLVRIMHDERRHCAILKRRTGREMAPDPKRVFWYVWIMRVLGPAFVVRQMELCEKGTEASYSLYAEREEFIRIASEEKRHGEDLTNLAGGMRLSYMSSVVLGLNDALVEFTGALAGFTLALNEPRLGRYGGETSAAGRPLYRNRLPRDGRHSDNSLSAFFECRHGIERHASGRIDRDSPVQLLLRRGAQRKFQAAFF